RAVATLSGLLAAIAAGCWLCVVAARCRLAAVSTGGGGRRAGHRLRTIAGSRRWLRTIPLSGSRLTAVCAARSCAVGRNGDGQLAQYAATSDAAMLDRAAIAHEPFAVRALRSGQPLTTGCGIGGGVGFAPHQAITAGLLQCGTGFPTAGALAFGIRQGFAALDVFLVARLHIGRCILSVYLAGQRYQTGRCNQRRHAHGTQCRFHCFHESSCSETVTHVIYIRVNPDHASGCFNRREPESGPQPLAASDERRLA